MRFPIHTLSTEEDGFLTAVFTGPNLSVSVFGVRLQ